MAAGGVIFIELFGFIKIRNCRRNKEDSDVQPVGRFADGTVVGIKNDGDQDLPKKNAPKFDAPEICAI